MIVISQYLGSIVSDYQRMQGLVVIPRETVQYPNMP